MDEATLAFAREHVGDDVNRLLLSGCDGVDARAAARQIEGLRTAQTKWPSLAACANVEYPPRLNCEQSSSEATARYKAAIAARLMQGGGVAATVADLTGGMGIDSWAMAAVAERVHYVELDAALCDLAGRNFAALGVRNISTYCTDGIAWLRAQNERFGLIYIDPSRRDVNGRRTVALEHCRPDVLRAWPLLTSHAGRVMVKAAPMIDLAAATAQLGDVAEVHVVAVGGECKEVLMVSGQTPEPVVTCVNMRRQSTDVFAFTPSEEHNASPLYASQLERYIYEPNAAVMKGGAFGLAGLRFGLAKLDRNTHLYTSDRLVEDFPGRVFELQEQTPLTPKEVRRRLPDGRASVVCRNHPLKAQELQRRLKLADGGDLCLIGTTVMGRITGLICRIVKGLA